MNPSVQLFIYFITGITFAISAVNLTIALRKGSDKIYLVFGLMGLCVGIYYFLFPAVFDSDPGAVISKIALFFFISSFALMPWLICLYTGYCRYKIQWGLSAGMLLSYIILLFTFEFAQPVIWNISAHLVLIGIMAFGYKAANYQRKNQDVLAAWFMLAALIILTLLTIDDIFRVHLNEFYPINISDEILPLDYFLIFFMIIMGLKFASDIQQKYILERSVNIQERRWKSFLEKVQLLVIGVDGDNTIYYVNPFFLTVTGYREEEIIGRHYMVLIPEDQKKKMQEVVDSINSPDDLPYYQGRILTAVGEEKTIRWSVVGMYSEVGELLRTLSIGADITQQLTGLEEIRSLKIKLEEENVLLKAELGKIPISEKIIGKSDAIRYVLQRALQVSSLDSTVLLEGETGVGKELVANYIQSNSLRAGKPFIKINCAAIPAALLESELFGHTKGAFTGADRNKKGMVELADGGTLLLDEVGEFPMELQPKLLRFLQEGEFVSLGSEKAKNVDVRIIAATNRNLLDEIEDGKFRNDLYYRLYVYPITIPPLRNRAEDIKDLIDVFVRYFANRHRKPIKRISKKVVESLEKYSWPGNIRELQNIIERAVIVCTTDTIKEKDLSPAIGNDPVGYDQQDKKIATLMAVERQHILKALKSANWKIHGKNGAAEILGINPSTLRSRMLKLDIKKS